MWDWFVNFLTSVLAALQGLVGDWGLAIIVLTFIIRVLLTPLMAKSSSSTARMQLMQPKLTELQERYADDPERLAEETRKIYAELGFNPISGCLPIFLQMPIFFALFTVARQVPADASFFNILPSLGSSASNMVDSAGIGGAIVYILLVVLFGVLTLIPIVFNQQTQTGDARRTSLMMGVGMSAMMMWFGWSLPSAVLLYYNTSALWQVIQQRFIISSVMKQAREEAEAQMADAPVEVDVVRRERKKRPHKKG